MSKYLLPWLLSLIIVPTTVVAQTVSADRFRFNTGPCVLRSGAGTPEAVVTGNVCDSYWRTDTGSIYTKTSGIGNTGWALVSGVSGSGTANSLAKWTSTTTLGNASITDNGATVTVMPTGDVVFSNGGDIHVNPTGNDLYPSNNYDINLGLLSKKFLSLHAAELWVETLVAQNTMATIGGRILVGPTTTLMRDVAAADTTIYVKHNAFLLLVAGIEEGSKLLLEAAGKFEVLFVSSATTPGQEADGSYGYAVVRNQDGTGANDWYAGDAVFDTGMTGSGFIDLYSVRGVKSGSEAGPTIVGNVRNSGVYNDWSPRWAIGNLNGLYGYTTTTYGAALGVPTAAWIKIDPTNGIRIGHNVTDKITLSAATGDASFTGSVTAAAGTIGGWTLGATDLYSGTGATMAGMSTDAQGVSFFAGAASHTVAPFRVYNTGALVATNATITGAITATSGSFTGTGSGLTNINGGNIQTGTITATQIAATTITAANLNVTALSAISANLGTVTAGSISGVTATFGGSGGEVTLNSTGISLVSGTDAGNQVKWSSGDYINTYLNVLNLRGTDAVRMLGGAYPQKSIVHNGGALYRESAGIDLGTSANPWDTTYTTNATIGGLAGGGVRFVCVTNAGVLYASATACV